MRICLQSGPTSGQRGGTDSKKGSENGQPSPPDVADQAICGGGREEEKQTVGVLVGCPLRRRPVTWADDHVRQLAGLGLRAAAEWPQWGSCGRTSDQPGLDVGMTRTAEALANAKEEQLPVQGRRFVRCPRPADRPLLDSHRRSATPMHGTYLHVFNVPRLLVGLPFLPAFGNGNLFGVQFCTDTNSAAVPMVAFWPPVGRATRIWGSKGEQRDCSVSETMICHCTPRLDWTFYCIPFE